MASSLGEQVDNWSATTYDCDGGGNRKLITNDATRLNQGEHSHNRRHDLSLLVEKMTEDTKRIAIHTLVIEKNSMLMITLQGCITSI